MGWNGRKPLCQMTRSERDADRLAYRMRYLPLQLDATRRKLVALEAEAARYGMVELLEVRPHG